MHLDMHFFRPAVISTPVTPLPSRVRASDTKTRRKDNGDSATGSTILSPNIILKRSISEAAIFGNAKSIHASFVPLGII